MAFIYLGERFLYRIVEFLRHWYVKSGKIYSNFVLNKLSQIDEVLALRITWNHLLEPLYKDYSIVGRILGFVFRTIRLVLASVVYILIFAVSIFGYLLWLLIPPAVVWQFFMTLS